ncbi:acetyl-CoA acetyltransferase [Candidatus Heimdallarchaeota archaeon B3_Heim]|nr:MAG: acetyl-CoA acetyltransferase [Candidatus Heimdallarchaeota archaeon B3_Heim]
MDNVVIVEAVRSAIGSFGGTLKDIQAPDIASVVMKAVIERNGVENIAEQINDVRFGCCVEDNRYMNVARIAALRAGIPKEVPAVTLNRVCTSAMEAIVSGMHQIQAEPTSEIILAGGVESMSTIPYLSYDMRWGSRYFDKVFVDGVMEGLKAGGDKLMGMTAEILAEEFKLTREELDEVAYRSHQNALKATSSGRFKDEIVPIEVKTRKGVTNFEVDEHPRDYSLDQLAKMRPVFKKDGVVTSGNASGINDGAAAVLIMSESKADDLGIKSLAKIVGYGISGVDPDRMGMGPVPATKNLFSKVSDYTFDDIGLIEMNEAFAATYLAAEREMGFEREIANVNGSGIGLGHPVGCTGSRITVTLLHEMIKRQESVGLSTLCGGGGLGMSLLLTRDI